VTETLDEQAAVAVAVAEQEAAALAAALEKQAAIDSGKVAVVGGCGKNLGGIGAVLAELLMFLWQLVAGWQWQWQWLGGKKKKKKNGCGRVAVAVAVAGGSKKKKKKCGRVAVAVAVWQWQWQVAEKNGPNPSSIGRDMIVCVAVGGYVAVAVAVAGWQLGQTLMPWILGFFFFFYRRYAHQHYFLQTPTLPLPLFFLLPTTISHLILPLPRSYLYHSNRTELLFPTVPLPPCHCHSLFHCRLVITTLPLFFSLKNHFFSVIFNRPPPCQYCHCHTLFGTIRTALISSFQRCHSHPTTATPHPGSRPRPTPPASPPFPRAAGRAGWRT
jgi:hypothetical protein